MRKEFHLPNIIGLVPGKDILLVEPREAIRDSVILRYKCPKEGGYIQEHRLDEKKDAFLDDGTVVFWCELCQNDHSFKLWPWVD